MFDLPVVVKEQPLESDGNGKECSEVLNSQQQPATPNSSSISSASSEAINDEHNKTVDQTNHQLNKQWVSFSSSIFIYLLVMEGQRWDSFG